jgi:putative Mg2+ transporter-C (MgtC) family protein
LLSIDPDYLWPVIGSVVAGGLIGLEREFRGRPAGLRTHILVCLASGLLMLAAVHQVHWLSDTPDEMVRIDPVRMAHGVLTGVGFLCGGVIFREGFNVHGLTTAASLWITSALGTLYGVGFYTLAIGGTVVTLFVLTAVGFTENAMPRRLSVDIKLRYSRSSGMTEAKFRAALAAHGLETSQISSRLEADVLEFSGTFQSSRRVDSAALAARLASDAEVLGFDYLPHKA